MELSELSEDWTEVSPGTNLFTEVFSCDDVSGGSVCYRITLGPFPVISAAILRPVPQLQVSCGFPVILVAAA